MADLVPPCRVSSSFHDAFQLIGWDAIPIKVQSHNRAFIGFYWHADQENLASLKHYFEQACDSSLTIGIPRRISVECECKCDEDYDTLLLDYLNHREIIIKVTIDAEIDGLWCSTDNVSRSLLDNQ